MDNAKLKKTFGWHPVWNVEHAMEKVAEWTVAYVEKRDMYAVMCEEMDAFISLT